ncbi:tRNA(Ile)-lysidine synthase [compost metagenome]
MPPEREHWAGWRDLRDAAVDAAPLWRLGAGELHRAGGRLWWLSGDWLQPLAQPVVDWLVLAQPLELPGNGQVWLQGQLPEGRLQIRYRQGGEVLDLPGRGHRDLKRLLQESALPAFVRGRLPLLYAGEKLIAVANLPQLQVVAAAPLQLRWLPPTGGPGLS